MTPDPQTFGVPPDPERTGHAFRELCDVVARLRAPDGCPWDREQTLESIKPHTLEEACELLEAIDSGDDDAIVEELGDVLLQVVLDAQIGKDEGRFELAAVIEGITAKLVRRHPHVFGDVEAETSEQVLTNWERIKQTEKKPDRESLLDGIPAALPQLARALKLTKKAAKVGYDFPQRTMLFDKLTEELHELAEELFNGGEIPHVPAEVDAPRTPDEPITDPERLARVESEVGDLLFVVANIARRWGVDPEEALRKSNRKFARRFRAIEAAAEAEGRSVGELSLVEMEAFYQAYKARESDETA